MNWIKTKDKLPENGQRILIKTIDLDTAFLVGKFYIEIGGTNYVELIPTFGCVCGEGNQLLIFINEFSHWIALEDIDQPND